MSPHFPPFPPFFQTPKSCCGELVASVAVSADAFLMSPSNRMMVDRGWLALLANGASVDHEPLVVKCAGGGVWGLCADRLLCSRAIAQAASGADVSGRTPPPPCPPPQRKNAAAVSSWTDMPLTPTEPTPPSPARSRSSKEGHITDMTLGTVCRTRCPTSVYDTPSALPSAALLLRSCCCSRGEADVSHWTHPPIRTPPTHTNGEH